MISLMVTLINVHLKQCLCNFDIMNKDNLFYFLYSLH